jgi:hypothetical protein
MRRTIMTAILLSFAVVGQAAFAQQSSTTAGSSNQDGASIERQLPTASHGGKAQLLPPKPISEADDPVNQRVAADTVDGLVVVVTIDGTKVTLDSASPARVPKRMTRAERVTGGDTVKATAFAGGKVISTTLVPDNVVNASEGEGLVRNVRRQISLALKTDSPVDTVTIEAPATGAMASLDVRFAYAQICKADPKSKWCPR